MLSSEAFLTVARHAAGSAEVARNLEQAHELGVAPGPCREPWGLEFNRRAVPIFLKTMPEAYVRGIGVSSAQCARLMRGHGSGAGPGESWALLTEQFEAVAVAAAERVGDSPRQGPVTAASGPVPAVIRYDQLARLVHPEGLARLVAAAGEVEAYCRSRAHGGVSATEIGWLRAFARGERVVDVAAGTGLSEREFYRLLRRLWDRLGVTGRAEALALAARRGWLDEGPG